MSQGRNGRKSAKKVSVVIEWPFWLSFTLSFSKKIIFSSRLFLISLQKSAQDIFSDDVIFENTQGPISFNTEKIYSGFLEGKQTLLKSIWVLYRRPSLFADFLSAVSLFLRPKKIDLNSLFEEFPSLICGKLTKLGLKKM
jgi:hypothetical protein